MQAFLEELANNDLLGLIGFAIHRLDPTRESQDPPMGKVYCSEFKQIVLAMINTLGLTSSSSIKPSYFFEYMTEWLKHLQYNDIFSQMAGSEHAKTCAVFRRELLWDVITRIGPKDVSDEVNLRLKILILRVVRGLASTRRLLQFAMSNAGLDDRGAKLASESVSEDRLTNYL
ncbi:unnamed protein product [Rhizoctonia solani]|uniref:Uncharacterized protein n=1 Tax=Rhizoctonia solani TaxID=456999 RepID=A0A8H3DRL6_9AGAM|nr:unnamed protein product [Rhizoctonia solani]